jgi:hypothetical protein
MYVGLNPHGQQWLTRLIPHKKVVRDFAWFSMPLVNGNAKPFYAFVIELRFYNANVKSLLGMYK